MADFSRRDFLRVVGMTTAGALVAGSALSLAGCGQDSQKKSDKDKESGAEVLAALRVSSDLYATPLAQRFAFSIFNSDQKVVSKGTIPVTLISPSKKQQQFEVPVREKGIPKQGIYSVTATLDEPGSWLMKTTFSDTPLDLAFSVSDISTAPALDTACPDIITPTDANPLDASILCTRFEGNCGLHTHSVPDLLATGQPFVVLFATPARCQTSYCGPVLDLTRNVAHSYPDIPVVHIEIYKNETTTDVLDAVSAWNLPSEPWMFGVRSSHTINARLDGAFDQSEIEELFSSLS